MVQFEDNVGERVCNVVVRQLVSMFGTVALRNEQERVLNTSE